MTREQTISSMHACVNAAIFCCDWCNPWQRSVLQDFTDQLQSAMDGHKKWNSIRNYAMLLTAVYMPTRM